MTILNRVNGSDFVYKYFTAHSSFFYSFYLHNNIHTYNNQTYLFIAVYNIVTLCSKYVLKLC